MKRIIVSLLALLAVTTLSAQRKGEMYAGGSLGLGVSSLISGGVTASAAALEVAPEFGYFAAKNFKIGAHISYGLEKGDPSTHTLQIMPNVAYYIKITDKFYYTPGAEIGFVCGVKEKVAMPGFGVGLSLGSFEFRPTERLGLSVNLLSLEYMLMTYRDKNYDFKLNMNAVNFRLGTTPSVGVKYYF